jgi:hypothetical protein
MFDRGVIHGREFFSKDPMSVESSFTSRYQIQDASVLCFPGEAVEQLPGEAVLRGLGRKRAQRSLTGALLVVIRGIEWLGLGDDAPGKAHLNPAV